MYTNDKLLNALYIELCEQSNNCLKKDAAIRIVRYTTKRLQNKDRKFDAKQVADSYATKLLPTIKAENFKTDTVEVSVDRRTGKQMYPFFKSHFETLSDHQFLCSGKAYYNLNEVYIATNADLTKPAYIMADKIGVKYILGGNMLTVLKSLA